MGGPQSLKSFCYPCAVSAYSFLFIVNSLCFNEHTLSVSFCSEFDLDSYLDYYSVVEKSFGLEARERTEITCFLSAYPSSFNVSDLS